MSGIAESEAERHREAGGVRGGEQLLRIGSFAVLEPGQDTSEPGPARVGAGPCALTNRQLTRARLQIACPLSTAIAGRHRSPHFPSEAPPQTIEVGGSAGVIVRAGSSWQP